MRPFSIEVYSDFVCPWCYVGKRYLRTALDRYLASYPSERQPDLSWRPFLLHAAMPATGMDRQEYLQRRFAGQAPADEMLRQVEASGRAVGIEFRFDRIRRQPSTLDAHRLVVLAARHACAEALIGRLCHAFFIAGLDISAPEVLQALAREVGLPDAEVQVCFNDERARERILQQDAAAKRRGITTVPFLVVNGRKGVSALQPPEMLFEALRWARKDAARPKWWPSFL